MSKKRMTRKELKAPDKVLTTMGLGLEAVNTHRRVLIIGAVVLVVAVGLYVVYHVRTTAKAEDGAKLFHQGLRTYTAGVDPSVKPGTPPKEGEEIQAFSSVEDRAKAALAIFDRIVRDFEGYSVARMAHFYRGRCLHDQKKHGEAIDAFKKVLSTKSGGCGGGDLPGSGALDALALESLGAAQAAKGRLDDARQSFAKLRELDKGNRRDWGHYHEALVLEAKGDIKGAIAAYEKVKASGQSSKGEDPTSSFTHSPLNELSTKRARYLQMLLDAGESPLSLSDGSQKPRPGDKGSSPERPVAPSGEGVAPSREAPAPGEKTPAPAGDAPSRTAPTPAIQDVAPAGDDVAPGGESP